MKVTDNGIGDAPMVPNLLRHISLEEELVSVSGDGTYDTRGCHEAIAVRRANAIIPIPKMPSHGRRITLERLA